MLPFLFRHILYNPGTLYSSIACFHNILTISDKKISSTLTYLLFSIITGHISTSLSNMPSTPNPQNKIKYLCLLPHLLQFFLNITQRCNLRFRLLKIQSLCIIGIELCESISLLIAFFEILIII